MKSLKGLGLENKKLSIASAGAILNYLELTSHNELGHITTLRSIDRLGTMRLDSFTFRSLEILQPMSYEGGKSLLDVLDATVTPMGDAYYDTGSRSHSSNCPRSTAVSRSWQRWYVTQSYAVR